MFLIFASTVLARTGSETPGYDWTPFRLFTVAKWWQREDMILQIIANILMFVPLGLLLSPTMGWRSILFGLGFSLCIELCQLLFSCGFSEIDDVIHNTLGVFIGYSLYVILTVYSGGQEQVYRNCIKRLLDILISLAVLIVLSPVYLITAIAIKLESKGPVIFKQTRLGLHHKEFTLLKFRSMVVNAEHTGSGVYSRKNDSRVTKVGRIIRATSIDELPQVINILKGDMSLIGPRPPLTYHPWPIDQYTQEQLHMFDLRPGITGWAQVHGRKDVEWHERIKLNNWYVDNCSFLLDLKIVFMTIGKVLTNADNENTGATVK
ncbi:MAG: sugar transferase [Clostridia bacterium]|nr:sugar transferase [Clostridia bacterium]